MTRASKVPLEAHETSERRAESRERMILRVGLLAHGERATFALVRNISPTGAQLRLYGRVREGTDVTLRMGDEEPIAGSIAWAQDDFAGVEFDNMLDSTMLLRALQKLPPEKRRSSPRVKAAARVLLRTGGRTYPAELQDVSAIGARIRTLRPVKLGPSVMVTLPDLPAIKAFVRWNEETDLGLAFDAPLPIQLIAEWMNERLNVSG